MPCSHYIKGDDKKTCDKCISAVRKWKLNNPERTKELNMKSLNKNREKWKNRSQKHFFELKSIVIDYYSNNKNKCVCCGENHFEFLTIDHINGGGLAHRRKIKTTGGGMFYRWLIQNDFPIGYQVMCWNCNWAKWRYGKCPHQK